MAKKILKVELHTHTNYSYDCDTSFDEIIKVAKEKKIDALAVCDHNQITGAQRLAEIAPFKVIVGQEILTKEGEIIGLFLKKFIKSGQTMLQTIKEIKKQNGLVYLPHPFDKTTRKTAASMKKIDEWIKLVDIVEVHNGRTILPSDNQKALSFALKYNKTHGVGSDAHTKWEFGRNYMLIPEFSNSREFLQSLRKAKLVKSRVMLWIFLFTKVARFRKKHNLYKQKTILESNLACDTCGNTKVELLYKKKGTPLKKYFISDDSYGTHPQIVKCVECNLIFAFPREETKKIIERYEEFQDPKYEQERLSRSLNQAKILTKINKLKEKKGKLLEVGSATGLFLEMAKKDGWEVTGVEPSTWATKIARKHGIDVKTGTLDTVRLPEEHFDAIVILDVIEHVPSPRALLKSVSKLIKPEGIVCIVTPQKNSFIASVMGEKWWHIRPDHIFYFTRSTIKLLLNSQGFSILKVDTYGWTFSYDYWATRFRKLIPMVCSFLLSLKRFSFLDFITNRSYTFDFHDSMEIYCKKD